MVLENILTDLCVQGYSVQENFLDTETVSILRSEAISEYTYNQSFKSAGVGTDATVVSDIRRDKIHWLKESSLTEAQRKVWSFMEEARQSLNQRCFLGLAGFEAHLTIYPEGAFYKKHYDTFKKSQASAQRVRKVSFILYLNEDWLESDGGQLQIYNQQDKLVASVLPVAGTVVIFLSEEFPHEVFTTKRKRTSFTGWFYTN